MCIVRNLFFVVVLWVVGALNLYGQCDRMGWITAIDSCGVTILDIRNGTSLKALPGVFQLQNNTTETFQINLWLDEEYLNGEITCSEDLKLKYEIYETDHLFQSQWWGGYTRHNKIWKKIFDVV